MKYSELKKIKYIFNENIKYRDLGDMLMAYNTDNGDTYEFNEIGGEIFKFLIAGIEFNDIIQKLLSEYNVQESDIKEDIEEIFNRMIELKIIIIK